MNKGILCAVAIVFTIASNVSAQGNAETRLTETSINALIDSICIKLTQNYVYPDKARLIRNHLEKLKDQHVYQAGFPLGKIASEINGKIRSVSSDKHIRIEYNPELEKDIRTFLSSNQGKVSIDEKDIFEDSKKNFHFRKVEILPANIGYIELNGFAVPSPQTSKTIHAAMQFVASSNALIIDLRNNFGGNGRVVGEIMSYFFTQDTKLGRTYNRREDRWTDQFVTIEKDKTLGLHLNMPIYILTSHRTFSAAESFAYHLKYSRNAVLVGDTTRGGAHLTRSFSLGNGFVAFIPYARGESIVTHTDWEGIGVIPTYAVDEGKSLRFVQVEILKKRLENTRDQTERNKIDYLLNYYRLEANNEKYQIQKVIKVVGIYDYFEVTYSKNQGLLFMDKKNFKVPTVMKYISGERFQINNDYQVEFVISKESGECTGMKMFWDDGYEEFISKNGL